MSESGFGGKPSVFTRFFGDVFSMPVWQKLTLGVAALLGGTGVAGQTYSHYNAAPPGPLQTQVQTDNTFPPPANSHEIVGTVKTPEDSAPASPTEPQPAPSFFEQNAPAMTRVGLSFVGAFIIGWAFRVFVKAMLLITVLGAALLMGLSYFHVVNVDFSEARTKYADSIAWVADQAAKLRDAAVAHLPASGSSMVGLFVGFRKK